MNLNTFQQISEENFRSLEEYVARMRTAGLKLPSWGGKVNKTAVATACGFNRETFNQNDRFKKCLKDAVDDLGLEEREEAEKEQPRRDNVDKARVTMLEQQLAALRGENYELRRKLARYEHSTLTGKRVIP